MISLSIRPEHRIVTEWRNAGAVSSVEARDNVLSAAWCRARLNSAVASPLSRGDLALIMEHSPDREARMAARVCVLRNKFVCSDALNQLGAGR